MPYYTLFAMLTGCHAASHYAELSILIFIITHITLSAARHCHYAERHWLHYFHFLLELLVATIIYTLLNTLRH
jgi:hypothetical protein